jgi:YHS domain-containing protein
LFIGLYKSGTAYVLKEKAERSSDLTCLSAGAVYSNGLEMIRYTNIALMTAFVFDAGKMAAAAAPLIATPPAAIEAAIQADKVNTRSAIQRIQTYAFGVELPNDVPLGAYPALIELEGHSIAGDNGLKNNFVQPLFFYNIETTSGLGPAVKPDMSLRFRNAGELIPQAPQALYSLSHNGQRYYFTEDQVEPARNPRHPNEKRVRRDLDPYGGMWVRKDNSELNSSESGSGELVQLLRDHKSAVWIFSHLRGLLAKIKLDVTHNTEPPDHTLVLVSQFPRIAAVPKKDFTQISSVVLEGGGLAAWDVGKPRFQIHLQKKEVTDLPAAKSIAGGISGGFSNFSKYLHVLDGIQ